MATPRFELLRSRDLRAGLDALGDIADAGASPGRFAEASVQVLARLVRSDLTTLSRCDLHSARRSVVGQPPGAVGAAQRAAFDRHFHEHPLVQHHAIEHGRHTHRISDSLPDTSFRETALYHDYYRPIGLSHALAMPLRMDGRELASFVLNRQGRDFSDRELALLDSLRRPLARLFDRLHGESASPPAIDPRAFSRWGLTARESEVLHWVAAGKTDRDVAALLGCSPRTVHKHLQRVYTKLGVETRTAAVMRVLGRG